ncbi:sulfur carrier protein ThiS adenylyltransferase ThiF [Thermoanaerobacter sp. CM-CNRG TB177]|jgi:sulfur carrier protein ThiS adenylyltransferase|uniref:sulfur carrier protein ThiS adenylyltransferase ThiF n=1 Tax=Thermoanaerobacter sp. CM-CNRG TB177 TaxID=2800659 RepID=UPI001BDF3CE5|nr:sulfur carrier protein ThiS adenylyltransferase ThiF [Thermoanaerobacter sp. CM-CNRG TB177]MBT1278773.1 sulfur carrier protein ThiS adenylyltransferase ThiF [Thermoanaerobacter sp. CM-CNRG TB177]
MNLFDMMLKNYFDEKMLEKLSKVKILIIGCGGLGSNIAVMLVRSGIKNLTIVDFDKVDILNLNRQNYFFYQVGEEKVSALKDILSKINPSVNVKAKNIKIDESNLDELILQHDIIVEAVDNELTKTLIFRKAHEHSKKVVLASGVAGFGDCENIKIKRGKDFAIIGDFVTSINDKKPFAPKVIAVAAMQADEVLRIVSELE